MFHVVLNHNGECFHSNGINLRRYLEDWMFIVVSSVDSWGLLFCCRYVWFHRFWLNLGVISSKLIEFIYYNNIVHLPVLISLNTTCF
ncbi:hypothetical protein Hanom_Chr07g00655971 [Helianthus anomalus]